MARDVRCCAGRGRSQKLKQSGQNKSEGKEKQSTYCILIRLVLLEQSRVNETKAEDKTGNNEDMTLRSAKRLLRLL